MAMLALEAESDVTILTETCHSLVCRERKRHRIPNTNARRWESLSDRFQHQDDPSVEPSVVRGDFKSAEAYSAFLKGI